MREIILLICIQIFLFLFVLFDLFYLFKLQKREKYKTRILKYTNSSFVRGKQGVKDCKETSCQSSSSFIFQYCLAFFFGLICFFFGLFFLKDFLMALLFFFLGILFFFSFSKFLASYRKKRRQKEIRKDLLRAVTLMSNAFQAGRSATQAIQIVSSELDGPLQEEFQKMEVDLSYGLSLEEVFQRFQKRVSLKEVQYLATSISILNQTGGEMTSVFSSLQKNFLNRKRLEEELKNLTASAKLVFKILISIPPIFALLLIGINSSYFSPLFQTKIGRFIFLLLLLIYFVYIALIRRILYLEEVDE